MSCWNIRVCREQINSTSTSAPPEYTFSLREVYYTDHTLSEITLHSSQPITVQGDTLADITDYIEKMNRALTYPTINLDALEFAGG